MSPATFAIRSRQCLILSALCLALLVFIAASTPAALGAGKPGRLDRGFSGDGKVVTTFPLPKGTSDVNYQLPFEYAPGRIATAATRGGRVVAANSLAIVMSLPNGRRNPGFGGNGAVPILHVEGVRFRLSDVAFDSQGRVLIAGTTKPETGLGLGGLPLPGPIPSVATIVRYLPNGQPDPSFGIGGVVNTDFGAPPPTSEGKPYPGTAVGLVGIAVDTADRPILTGSAVAEVGRCTGSQRRYEASRGIVARLTATGVLDPSFAGTGLKAIAGISWLGSPGTTSSSVVSAGAPVDPCHSGGPGKPSVLLNLGYDGNVNAGFSGNGLRSRPFTRIADVAVAPSGKLTLLTRTIELRRGKWVESRGRVVRLRANGSFDASFGRRGRADLPLPRRGSVVAIAVDPKGRVLLAGSVRPRSQRGKAPGSRFLLIRLTAAGEPDRSFGRRGRVATGFGRRTNVRATDVLLTRAGRISVAGKFSGPSTGNALALARYLGRR